MNRLSTREPVRYSRVNQLRKESRSGPSAGLKDLQRDPRAMPVLGQPHLPEAASADGLDEQVVAQPVARDQCRGHESFVPGWAIVSTTR